MLILLQLINQILKFEDHVVLVFVSVLNSLKYCSVLLKLSYFPAVLVSLGSVLHVLSVLLSRF